MDDNHEKGILENILRELKVCLEFTGDLRLYRGNVIKKSEAPKRKAPAIVENKIGRPRKNTDP